MTRPGSHAASWVFAVRVERDDLDGGWIAECLDLPGCMSQGETEAEVLHNVTDAIAQVISVRLERPKAP